MAGPSKDFEEHGHAYPKYLLDMDGEPIIQKVIECLNTLDAELSFIVRKDDDDKAYIGSTLKILAPNANIYSVNTLTQGAVCSALFAIDCINNDNELVILNGDQFIKCGINEALNNFRNRNLDGGIITFSSIHPRWSYVALDENKFVNETSEKRPISNMATAGFYYFKHGNDFVNAAFDTIRKDVNYDGKYYICSTYNELVLCQKRVGVFNINKEDYVSFATPQLYENYLSNIKK